jgi:gas vesicle protein
MRVAALFHIAISRAAHNTTITAIHHVQNIADAAHEVMDSLSQNIADVVPEVMDSLSQNIADAAHEVMDSLSQNIADAAHEVMDSLPQSIANAVHEVTLPVCFGRIFYLPSCET